MGSAAIVIGNEFTDSRPKMSLVDRNDEIQTFSPNGADDPFAEGIGGRRSDWSPESTDSKVSKRGVDRLREDGVAIMNHKSILMVIGQKFAELLNRPFGGGMIGYVDMQNPTGTNIHHHEDVEDTKSRGDGNEEIAGNCGLRMVTNERRPSLITSRTAMRIGTQIFPYGSWRYSDSELHKQFVRNALLAPGWILPIHSANDFAQVRRQGGTATPARFPFPEVPECVTMPFEEGCRLYDHQSIAPVEESSQRYHQQAKCSRCSSRREFALLEKSELFAKEKVLRHQGGTGEKEQAKEGDQYGFYAIPTPFQG